MAEKEGHREGMEGKRAEKERGQAEGKRMIRGRPRGDIHLFDDFFKGFVMVCGCFISTVR